MVEEEEIKTPMKIVCGGCGEPVTADQIICDHCGEALYPFEPQFLYTEIIDRSSSKDSEKKKSRKASRRTKPTKRNNTTRNHSNPKAKKKIHKKNQKRYCTTINPTRHKFISNQSYQKSTNYFIGQKSKINWRYFFGKVSKFFKFFNKEQL